ncbi:amidohydrolase [Candidatus Woesearchaeota archaeon]|nr:amidohydrolase [Candidatus Woesearchaeota archaeon]
MLLKNCRFVVTQNEKRDILEHVDILIERNKITKIGKHLKTKGRNKIKGKTIDCSDKIVMPGLINTHTHIGMHSLRGICDDEELPAWLDKVVAAEKKFTPKQIQQNAESACKEMLLSGTTTFVEMYTPIAPVLAGVKKHSLRAVLCPVIYGFLGNAKEQLAAAKKLIDDFSHPLITLGLGAHSIYTCDEQTLKDLKYYCHRKNLLTPIHLAETREERFDCFDKHKKLPAEYLASLGFLNEKTLLVHSIWLTKGEVRIIAQHKSAVAHCPVSNMKLSSGGVTPLMEMFEEGVVVGLGTDSVASNNSMDMFKEMMICGLLHKQHRWDPKAAPVQKLLDMATIDGAAAIGMRHEIGSLEVGKKADIICLDVAENHWPLSQENVLSHLVYSTTGRNVSTVVVDGKVVVKNKEVQ